MILESFYETIAQLCFTLLGLWWLVIQTRHDLWTRTRHRRRIATHISLYFWLPGGMSLISLIPTETFSLWRWAFVLASILGLVETLRLVARSEDAPRSRLLRVLRWAALPLYALILLVAFFPGLPRMADIEPLMVTAIALALIVLLGVNLAWDYFIEPPPDT
jgi:cytochrome bd-type quinol oxidase subunit 2